MVQNKEVINQADKTSGLENLKPEERASIQMNRTLKYLYSEESKQSFYEESDDKVTYKMDVVKDYLTHLCKKADGTLKSRKEMMDDMQRENRESGQDFRVSTPWIMAVQIVLEYLQYDIGAIDGNKGNTTIAAIKSFQRENGLTVDGDAGPATIAALLAKLPDSSDILENGIQENGDEEDDNQETIEPTDEINDDSEELEEKPEEESEEEPKEEQKEETDEDIIEPTNPEVIDNGDTVVEVGLTDIDIKEIDWVMKMINEDLNGKKFYVIEGDIVKINVTVIKEYLMKYKDMEQKDFQQEIGSRNYTIILAVQLMLYLRGYTKIKIDGLRGPQTISIIVELQKKYGIIADGVVGPVTISIIIEIILGIKPMPLPNPVIPVVPVIPVEPETPVETEEPTEEESEEETEEDEKDESDESLNENLGYGRVECDYLAKSEYPSENMIITNREYLLKLGLKELYEKYDDNYFKNHSLAIHYSDLTSTADGGHDITNVNRVGSDVFAGYKKNDPKSQYGGQVMNGECLYVEINKGDEVDRFQDNLEVAESFLTPKKREIRGLLIKNIAKFQGLDENTAETINNNVKAIRALPWFDGILFGQKDKVTLNLNQDVLQECLDNILNSTLLGAIPGAKENIMSNTNNGDIGKTLEDIKDELRSGDPTTVAAAKSYISSLKSCLNSFYAEYNKEFADEKVDINALNIDSQVDDLFA